MRCLAIFLTAFLLGSSVSSQAADYEFSHDITGYHCQFTTLKQVNGILTRWNCNSVVYMIDKEGGDLYRCNARFSITLLNGVYNGPAQPPPPTAQCAWHTLGLIATTPGKFSWQLLPAFDAAATDPTASMPPLKKGYWWKASGDQIEVCMQLPTLTGHHPTTPFFGETACLSPVPVVNNKATPKPDDEIVFDPPQ